MKRFDWKRFWHSREISPFLTSEGYLHDPETDVLYTMGKAYKQLEELENFPCLVLLGEPGTGKTDNIKDYYGGKSEENIIYHEFNAFSSEIGFKEEVFDDPKFLEWEYSSKPLTLILDGLDDGLIVQPNIANYLALQIKKYQTNLPNLSMIISCRTSVWPQLLEKNLIDLYSEQNVKVYKLAMLRHEDVKYAAEQTGIEDVADFMYWIYQMELIPFACNPTTLEFVLESYKNKNLLKDNWALYSQGCHTLIQKPENDKIVSSIYKHSGLHSIVKSCCKIAAHTLLSDRTQIDIGIPEESSEKSSNLADIMIPSNEFEDFFLSENLIMDALKTSLFRPINSSNITYIWNNAALKEFLAAYYLESFNLLDDQIDNLFFTVVDDEKRVYQQLSNVATWLSQKNEYLFKQLLDYSPNLLLGPQAKHYDEKTSTKIIKRLLDLVENEKLGFSDIGNSDLSFSNTLELRDAILPYLDGSEQKPLVKIIAIKIIHESEIKEHNHVLRNIAMNEEEDYNVRGYATRAIAYNGDAGDALKIKPLIELDDNDDEELKGYSLQALLNTGEISFLDALDLINPPKKDNFLGAYRYFIEYELASSLLPEELPDSLDWVLRLQPKYKLNHSYEVLSEKITEKAWENLNSEKVFEKFLKLIIKYLKNHERIIIEGIGKNKKNPLHQDKEKRHRILKTLLIDLLPLEKKYINLDSNLLGVSFEEDFEYLLSLLDKTDDSKIKHKILILIRSITYYDNTKHTEIVIKKSKNNPLLAEAFDLHNNPWILESEEAIERKEEYYEHHQQREKPRKTLEPPPHERVINAITQSEKDINLWPSVVLELTLKKYSTHYESIFHVDISRFPGWEEADDQTKEKIYDLAELALQDAVTIIGDWSERSSINNRHYSVLQALHLIVSKKSDVSINLNPKE
ncbi:MAG: hypothetical protein RAP03_02515, partial [Candidatus Electryonea clarkiae]|nr:hypothetical protein [Candidatus Electryonea clarkiae]